MPKYSWRGLLLVRRSIHCCSCGLGLFPANIYSRTRFQFQLAFNDNLFTRLQACCDGRRLAVCPRDGNSPGFHCLAILNHPDERTCLTWLMENCCCLMTIAYPDLLLPGGRFVGSRDYKSGLGEFARICRRRCSCDSFRNRPYGQPILSCPKENEGMSETGCHCFAFSTVAPSAVPF